MIDGQALLFPHLPSSRANPRTLQGSDREEAETGKQGDGNSGWGITKTLSAHVFKCIMRGKVHAQSGDHASTLVPMEHGTESKATN